MAMDYMLTRWAGLSRILEHGRICLTNNVAERALRGIAPGRKARLFAGSDRGGKRAASMHILIGTAKLNGVDPQTRPRRGRLITYRTAVLTGGFRLSQVHHRNLAKALEERWPSPD